MEAILHSALLRRERVELQYEAEFEQQGQLLFTYTESLFNILPIQPSNKRPRVACGFQFEQVPSCYDKENLVRAPKYSNEYAVKWQGTKEPHSRALADKDPNIRVYDSSVKNLACVTTGRADNRRRVIIPTVSEPPKCCNCQAPLHNADAEREVNLSTQFSVGLPVKMEVDERAGEERHVSSPQNGTHSLSNSNRKRTRNEGDGAIYVYEDNVHEGFQEQETDIEERAKKVMAKSVDERNDQNLARKGVVEEDQDDDLRRPLPKQMTAGPGRRGRAKRLQELEIQVEERAEKATAESVDERGVQCMAGKEGPDVGVVEEEREGSSCISVPKNKTAEPSRRGRPKRAAAASAATAQIPQRVTRAQARKHEPPSEPPRCETTSELMSTSQPSTKSIAREEKKVSSVVAPGIEEPGVQLAECNVEPTCGTYGAGTSDDGRHQSLQGHFHDTNELKIGAPCIETSSEEQVLNGVSLVKERISVIASGQPEDVGERMVAMLLDSNKLMPDKEAIPSAVLGMNGKKGKGTGAKLSLTKPSAQDENEVSAVPLANDPRLVPIATDAEVVKVSPLHSCSSEGIYFPVPVLRDRIGQPDDFVVKRFKKTPKRTGRVALKSMSPSLDESEVRPSDTEAQPLQPRFNVTGTGKQNAAVGDLIMLASEAEALHKTKLNEVGNDQGVVVPAVAEEPNLVKGETLSSEQDAVNTTMLEMSRVRDFKKSSHAKSGTGCMEAFPVKGVQTLERCVALQAHSERSSLDKMNFRPKQSSSHVKLESVVAGIQTHQCPGCHVEVPTNQRVCALPVKIESEELVHGGASHVKERTRVSPSTQITESEEHLISMSSKSTLIITQRPTKQKLASPVALSGEAGEQRVGLLGLLDLQNMADTSGFHKLDQVTILKQHKDRIELSDGTSLPAPAQEDITPLDNFLGRRSKNFLEPRGRTALRSLSPDSKNSEDRPAESSGQLLQPCSKYRLSQNPEPISIERNSTADHLIENLKKCTSEAQVLETSNSSILCGTQVVAVTAVAPCGGESGGAEDVLSGNTSKAWLMGSVGTRRGSSLVMSGNPVSRIMQKIEAAGQVHDKHHMSASGLQSLSLSKSTLKCDLSGNYALPIALEEYGSAEQGTLKGLQAIEKIVGLPPQIEELGAEETNSKSNNSSSDLKAEAEVAEIPRYQFLEMHLHSPKCHYLAAVSVGSEERIHSRKFLVEERLAKGETGFVTVDPCREESEGLSPKRRVHSLIMSGEAGRCGPEVKRSNILSRDTCISYDVLGVDPVKIGGDIPVSALDCGNVDSLSVHIDSQVEHEVHQQVDPDVDHVTENHGQPHSYQDVDTDAVNFNQTVDLDDPSKCEMVLGASKVCKAEISRASRVLIEQPSLSEAVGLLHFDAICRASKSSNHLPGEHESGQALNIVEISSGSGEDEAPDLGMTVRNLFETSHFKAQPESSNPQGFQLDGVQSQKVGMDNHSGVEALALDDDKYLIESRSFGKRDELNSGEEAVFLEHDMYPDVTLTLDRWQYRKRLSPRSKARARRWKSDVALQGEDHGQGQAADVPTISPNRATSSKNKSIELVSYEAFLQTPLAEVHKVATLASSSGGEDATNQDSILQQSGSYQAQRSTRPSIESLSNEIFSQAFQDGEDMEHSNYECEIMEAIDEKPENVNSMPLLQSIYKLSKACEMEMISASKFLEEGDQQQVECLIASANRIVEHLSIKKALPVSALLKTPKPNTSTLNNSKSSDCSPRDVYPEKFDLFSSTQCALPCSPREDYDSLPAYPTIPSFSPSASPSGIPTDLPTAVNDVTLLTENNTSTSTKHVNRVNLAGSMLPNSDFAFFQSGNEAASVASPAHFKPVCSDRIPRIASACKNCLSQEGAPASPSSSSTVADHFNPAAPIVKLTPVNSTSFTGRPARLKITESPLLSTGTASTIKNVTFPGVSVPECEDESILLRGVARQLTLRPTSESAEGFLACRPGSPLQQKAACKEDGSSTLSQLHSCLHPHDLQTSSLIPETVKGFDARTGPLSNYSDYPTSSTQKHELSVKLAANQWEFPNVSAMGSPVSVEVAKSRAEDGDNVVGDLKSSCSRQKQVFGGLSPPYHIRSKQIEDGAQSSKEAVALDETFIQKDMGGVTKGLLLSSTTTSHSTQPGAAVVLPFQLTPSHIVSQIHACSESAANSDFTFGVPSGLKARISLSLCLKPGKEKPNGLQDFNSGSHDSFPYNSSLGVPVAGVEKQTKKQGTPARMHTTSEDSPQELQDGYEVAFERQLGLPQQNRVSELHSNESDYTKRTFLPGEISSPSKELVAEATAHLTSNQTVEPQRSSNIVVDPTLKRSNLVSSFRSFVPLVHQHQPVAPYPDGKRDVKVKALEAAEAARKQAEQREIEKQERKKAMELAKREKMERAAQEKLRLQQAQVGHENQEPNKSAMETRVKPVSAGMTKTALADSSNHHGTNNPNVLLKVKRAMESKSKMEHDKQERLQEELRRKEEEWKRKEAEVAARKRKREAAEKKDREEKRKRQEEAAKAHRVMEERQRIELEEKAQKRKALEESERERKAMEEEMKRQKRLEKQKEIELRRKEDQDNKAAWLDSKEASRKRKEEAARIMKVFEDEGRQKAMKIARTSVNPSMSGTGPFLSYMSSRHLDTSMGEGGGTAPNSGVNTYIERHGSTSQSFLGPPLRVPQTTGEGTGVGRNSQVERNRSNSQGLLKPAVRVPRTTPEGVFGTYISISGHGQASSHTSPEATLLAGAATVPSGGVVATTPALRTTMFQTQPAVKAGNSVVAVGSNGSRLAHPGPPGGMGVHGDISLQSYEISPFRDSSDEDSEDEQKRSQKPIPQWARKEHLLQQLVRQLVQDPDDIFASASSCTLDEVFQTKGSKKRPDFRRRGSSGDWGTDRVTWQEEIRYKTTMGYLP